MAYTNQLLVNPVTGQTLRFLQTAEDTGGKLLEMESVFAPHSVPPAVHYHPKQAEVFTVLQGKILVRLNGHVFEMLEGDQFTIDPKTLHAMWNPFEAEAKLNWKVTPALTTESFLETGFRLAQNGAVNAQGMPSLLQAVLLLDAYRSVYRLAKPPYAVQRLLSLLLKPIARWKGLRTGLEKATGPAKRSRLSLSVQKLTFTQKHS